MQIAMLVVNFVVVFCFDTRIYYVDLISCLMLQVDFTNNKHEMQCLYDADIVSKHIYSCL